MNDSKKQVINGFLWRLLQSSSVQIVNFVVSTVLARILDPSDYGIIAMTSTFLSIVMVFINTGFSSSIIQKETIEDIDLNTMFWFGITIACVLFTFSYLAAPFVAAFYQQKELTKYLRIGSIIIISSSLFSVQQAILLRNLQFKLSFIASLIAAITSGLIGIAMAILKYGPLSLSVSTLANSIVYAIILWFLVDWKPKLSFSLKSFSKMYDFSIKVLLSSFCETIYNNIRSIIIGKRYSATDLAFYNRGEHLPSLIMTTIDGSVSAVMFPTLSKYQNNWEQGLALMRRSLQISLYICLPVLTGLFVTSKSFIIVLFSEKWIESIIYVRLCSIICAFWPLSIRVHALNARGRSDISFKLKLISIAISITLLLFTYKISVELMVSSTILSSFLNTLIGMYINQKYLDYTVQNQLIDIMKPLSLSLIMGIVVYSIQFLGLNYFITLFTQILVGIILYVVLSLLTKNEIFYYLLHEIKSRLN